MAVEGAHGKCCFDKRGIRASNCSKHAKRSCPRHLVQFPDTQKRSFLTLPLTVGDDSLPPRSVRVAEALFEICGLPYRSATEQPGTAPSMMHCPNLVPSAMASSRVPKVFLAVKGLTRSSRPQSRPT